jgi:hypothetical protein
LQREEDSARADDVSMLGYVNLHRSANSIQHRDIGCGDRWIAGKLDGTDCVSHTVDRECNWRRALVARANISTPGVGIWLMGMGNPWRVMGFVPRLQILGFVQFIADDARIVFRSILLEEEYTWISYAFHREWSRFDTNSIRNTWYVMKEVLRAAQPLPHTTVLP